VLQPELDTPEHARIRSRLAASNTAYINRILRQGRIHLESSDLTYKEEVAGSNPASPTLEKLRFAGKTWRGEKARDPLPGSFTPVVHQRGALGTRPSRCGDSGPSSGFC
jgi:hypothetical protein